MSVVALGRGRVGGAGVLTGTPHATTPTEMASPSGRNTDERIALHLYRLR